MLVLNHLPNFLTLFRIGAAPAILWLYSAKQIEGAIALTLVASLTDFLDGWTARALNRVTPLGAILDPVADKVLILSLFGMLYGHGAIPAWLFGISTLRNVSQLFAIPVLLWWKKIFFQVRPRLIPKWGSALSYVVITLGLGTMSENLIPIHTLLYKTLIGISFVLGILEVQILVTYWPRFIAIYRGRHDTFE